MEAPHDRQERAGRGSELESRPGTHTRVPRRLCGKWCAGQQMAAWPRVSGVRSRNAESRPVNERAYIIPRLPCLHPVERGWEVVVALVLVRHAGTVNRYVPDPWIQDVGCKECGSLTLTIGPVLKRHLTATYPNRDESRPPIGQSATPENSASTLTANSKSGEGEQKTPWKEFSFGKFITHTPTRHRRQGSVHRCCCRNTTLVYIHSCVCRSAHAQQNHCLSNCPSRLHQAGQRRQ